MPRLRAFVVSTIEADKRFALLLPLPLVLFDNLAVIHAMNYSWIQYFMAVVDFQSAVVYTSTQTRTPRPYSFDRTGNTTKATAEGPPR